MKNVNWFVVLGLGAVAYYAYREITRTKTVYIDSFDRPGLPEMIAATA